MSSKNCPMCFLEYLEEERMPMVVDCGHTICSVCVEYVMNHGKVFICPVCQKHIPFDAVMRSQVNYAMMDLIREYNIFTHSYDWHSTGKLKKGLTYKEKITLDIHEKCFLTQCFNPVFTGEDGDKEIFCSQNCLTKFQMSQEDPSSQPNPSNTQIYNQVQVGLNPMGTNTRDLGYNQMGSLGMSYMPGSPSRMRQ